MKLGLRRLRPETMAIVHGYRDRPTAAADGPVPWRGPLDPAAQAACDAPLLRDFCTQPLPRLKMERYDDDWVFCELIGDVIGRRGAVDLCFASRAHNLSLPREADGRAVFHSAVTFGTPAALVVSDILVHRPTFGTVEPMVRNHRSMAGDESPRIAARAQHLPMRDAVQALGPGVDRMTTPDVPRLAELISDVWHRTGWDPAEFDVFRVRTQYPVFGSVVKLQFHPSPQLFPESPAVHS